MNKKLTDRKEIVTYVKSIIRLGDRDKIKRVMNRYMEYVKEEERAKMNKQMETQIETAKKVFEID